jgi:hypothetical protein
MLTLAVTCDAEVLIPFTVMPAEGLKVTEETLARFDPVRVRLNVLPAGCELGDKPLRTGNTATISKNIELEVPLGFVTLRKNWPGGAEASILIVAVTCVGVELILIKDTPVVWAVMVEVFSKAHPRTVMGEEVPGALERGAVSRMAGPDAVIVKSWLFEVPFAVSIARL